MNFKSLLITITFLLTNSLFCMQMKHNDLIQNYEEKIRELKDEYYDVLDVRNTTNNYIAGLLSIKNKIGDLQLEREALTAKLAPSVNDLKTEKRIARPAQGLKAILSQIPARIELEAIRARVDLLNLRIKELIAQHKLQDHFNQIEDELKGEIQAYKSIVNKTIKPDYDTSNQNLDLWNNRLEPLADLLFETSILFLKPDVEQWKANVEELKGKVVELRLNKDLFNPSVLHNIRQELIENYNAYRYIWNKAKEFHIPQNDELFENFIIPTHDLLDETADLINQP